MFKMNSDGKRVFFIICGSFTIYRMRKLTLMTKIGIHKNGFLSTTEYALNMFLQRDNLSGN